MTKPTCSILTRQSYLQSNTHTHALTRSHARLLFPSLYTTFNSLWKRQVQTLIEPAPDLAPALSVRPAVLSSPVRSMSSQPGSQQAGSQASSHSTRLRPAGRGSLWLSPDPRQGRASLDSLARPQRGTVQWQALTTAEAGGRVGRGAQKQTGPLPILTLTTFHKPKSAFPSHTPPLFFHPSQHFPSSSSYLYAPSILQLL